MDDRHCRPLRDLLDEGDPGSIPASLAAHARTCSACGTVVRRQTELVRMLSTLPAAPRAEFGPPPVPAVPGGRLLPMGLPAWTAAAAAALLIAVVAWRVAPGGAERVRVVEVVDVAGAPPQVDERLLALTAGVEAVAMRRPTEIR